MNRHRKFIFLIVSFLLVSSRLTFSQTAVVATHYKEYVGGGEALAKYLSGNVRYPALARNNGIMGLSVFTFKVDCGNMPYDLIFKNKIGYGIEEEIYRLIQSTQGNWVPCTERDTESWINIKIAFTIESLFRSTDDPLLVVSGRGTNAMSDEKLVEQLRKMIKKGKKEKAVSTLALLIMRFPYNQEYKANVMELRKKDLKRS